MIGLTIIVAYLVLVPTLSLWLSGRAAQPGNADAYLGRKHDLPWWAICLSLVATETSTLTVISVPGVAYGGGMVFVGLAIGYLLGRIVVARFLLPHYRAGGMTSVYQYLGQRFGTPVQKLVSATFLLTRALAEGVRLFAGALPVGVLLASQHVVLPLWVLLLLIVVLTLAYTFFGGLRAVIWSDTIQFVVYLFGAVCCVMLLVQSAQGGVFGRLWDAGKLGLFHGHAHGAAFWTDPFTPLGAVVGGAMLTLASHGTDQLMVQRVLAARTLRDAQRALVCSALVVGVLFAVLSGVGVLLWDRSGGQSLHALGLAGPDAVFADFIVHGLPPALSGLLIAGVLAATMGSLSATLNAMAGASVTDFAIVSRRVGAWLRLGELGVARLMTVVWAAVLIGAASLFAGGTGSAVLFGLSVAAYAYGAMLGAFLLGMLTSRVRTADVVPAFGSALVLTAALVVFVRPGGQALGFTWLVPLGAAAEVGIGICLAYLRGAQRA